MKLVHKSPSGLIDESVELSCPTENAKGEFVHSIRQIGSKTLLVARRLELRRVGQYTAILAELKELGFVEMEKRPNDPINQKV
jgi:hypothetical protein